MSRSSFQVTSPEDSAGFLLWQTSAIWQRLIKTALEPYDISHSQFVILAVLLWLSEQQQPIQTMLIEMTKLDKMTVSQALKKLAAKDLIKRQEAPDDPRAKLVFLTIKGKTLIKKLVLVIEEVDQQFFNHLKKNDLQSFKASLMQLITNN